MLWSLPLLPLLLAPLVYLFGLRGGRAGMTLLAVAVVLATLGLAGLAIAGSWSAADYHWSGPLALTLELSTAGAIFAPMVPLVALPVVVYAGYHQGQGVARLLALLVAFVGAMQLLVLAADLLTLLMAWELVGACSWALIAHRWREAEVPREAAQALLVTRFGDLGLYIAAAALFAGSGGFDYAGLATLEGSLGHVAAAGIVLAAAAKSAQLPFSAWLFAAMAGPVPASALLHSATMVAAGLFLLVRLEPQLAELAWFMPATVAIGLVTALAGGGVASAQGHAKKLLAASTSAQYGLMWVAVGAGFPGVALLHFVTHAFIKAGLFLSAGLAERATGSYALAEMRLGRRLPIVALVTLILSLALAGVIPLGAAWTKEQVISAANHQSTWLALIVALAGGLSALYATRFQSLAFGRSERKSNDPDTSSTWAETGALAALALVTLGLSLLWWPTLHEAFGELSGIVLPAGHRWLLVLSLVLVLLGIICGVVMTRRSHSGRALAWQATVADWYGLPALTRGVAAGTAGLAACLARFDDRVLDAGLHALLRRLRRVSRGLARRDDSVVDAGLHAAARCGQWLAMQNALRGESLAEGLPAGLSRLADWSGQWARKVQSGQLHHYYTGVAAGLALFVVILVLGAYL